MVPSMPRRTQLLKCTMDTLASASCTSAGLSLMKTEMLAIPDRYAERGVPVPDPAEVRQARVFFGTLGTPR